MGPWRSLGEPVGKKPQYDQVWAKSTNQTLLILIGTSHVLVNQHSQKHQSVALHAQNSFKETEKEVIQDPQPAVNSGI
jgi:hypothetical protein